MFAPKNQQIDTLEAQQAFIRSFSFGLLISPSLCATHLPFILQSNSANKGVLTSHVARNNQHWKELEGSDVMVIFSGPHSYISPTWYSKHPAVPTWNYAAVHAYGKASLLSREQTLQNVQQAISFYEPSLHSNQTVMPTDTINKMLSGIVGISITLDKIEGINKLGQHKSNTDQQHTYQNLCHSKDADAQSLARYMHSVNLGLGN